MLLDEGPGPGGHTVQVDGRQPERWVPQQVLHGADERDRAAFEPGELLAHPPDDQEHEEGESGQERQQCEHHGDPPGDPVALQERTERDEQRRDHHADEERDDDVRQGERHPAGEADRRGDHQETGREHRAGTDAGRSGGGEGHADLVPDGAAGAAVGGRQVRWTWSIHVTTTVCGVVRAAMSAR